MPPARASWLDSARARHQIAAYPKPANPAEVRMQRTVTVHMIGNAHLDPVWLWHWQRGSDEALATCRAACDLLDDDPAFVFTRGEAWVHEQVRTLDPALFERIRGHVATGRWAVVNGWWVQTDTNLPTAAALLATARLGQAWFREHLGLAEVPVAYLVDSFGHGAYLPRLLREAGQRGFVFMRPQQHEHALPSCLFRWRSPDGAEVLTFRIPGGYGCGRAQHLEGHIRNALAAPRPDGVDHVMCFYGVGNHGGGPTRKTVAWIHAHREFAPGVRLEFSSPARFFAAVEAQASACPVVEGELQMHAPGCYSVCGALKRDLRSAELAVTDAERLLARCPQAPAAELHDDLDSAWKTICFNQFHDVLPGSSIAEAVAAARRQAGAARDTAERVTHHLLRRWSGIPACMVEGQRLHLVNRAPVPVAGLADVELWLDWQAWNHHLEGAEGTVVPHQLVPPASLICEGWNAPIPRLLLPIDLAAGEALTLRVADGPAPVSAAGKPDAAPPVFRDGALENGRLRVHFGPEGLAQVERDGRPCLARPLLLGALADGSDTWSHDIDRYAGPVQALAAFAAPVPVENGPLRCTVRLDGRIGGSRVRLYVALERGAARVDLRLETNYQEALTVLKASIAPAAPLRTRRDRVGGGWLERGLDGREYPVHHALRVHDGETSLGVLFPDSSAADVAVTGTVRVTLLRNSVHAYHSSNRLPQEEIPALRERFGTDEGPQALRLSLAFAEAASEASLESVLALQQQPPWAWDDYCGGSRLRRCE
jgi:alpha-mannosidase